MKAMIFAAGLGTRLRPLTDTLPKALVPVGDVPMLQRIIDKLVAAGIGEIVVNVCHLKQKVYDYLAENEQKVRVVLSDEDGSEPFETGGGIKRAASLLGKGRFLVHNVDILSNLDLRWFLSQDRSDSLATLLLVDAPADRYLLFDDDMRLVGWTNVRTGEVKSPFPDFNPDNYRRYSFCGIQVISDKAFSLMESWPDRFSIIDFYLKAAAEYPICGVLAKDLKLIDIGTPEKLLEASLRLREFE